MRRVSCVPLGYTRKLNQPSPKNKNHKSHHRQSGQSNHWKHLSLSFTLSFSNGESGDDTDLSLRSAWFSHVDLPPRFHVGRLTNIQQTWQTEVVGLFLPPMVSADLETSQSFEFHKLRQLNVELVPSKKVQNVGWQLDVTAVSGLKQFAKFGRLPT